MPIIGPRARQPGETKEAYRARRKAEDMAIKAKIKGKPAHKQEFMVECGKRKRRPYRKPQGEYRDRQGRVFRPVPTQR